MVQVLKLVSRIVCCHHLLFHKFNYQAVYILHIASSYLYAIF